MVLRWTEKFNEPKIQERIQNNFDRKSFIFAGMRRLKSSVVAGVLFQALAIFLILFNTPPTYSYAKNNSPNDVALLCLAPAPVVASREANMNFSFSFSSVQVNFLLEKTWRLATRIHTAELKRCSALKISHTLYNIYYHVPRIHAP